MVFIPLLMACNSDFEGQSGKVLTSLQVTVSDFEGSVGTRKAENGYQTSFTDGDQIGIFSLQTSGNTLLGNNVPYEYNSTTSSWQPVNAGTQVSVYSSGVTYYAYYPYNANMNGKKSIAEITTAFTLPTDQSTPAGYDSADLMTATGTLNGNTLNLPFIHAMSLIEIEIDEKSNSSEVYDPAPVFHGGITPWKMSDELYRYLVKPGASEVAFEYGPADNRYAFQKSLTATEAAAGKYTHIRAPFDNRYLELNTGNYAGVLGPVSKVEVNGIAYTTSPISGKNNRYIVNGVRKAPPTPYTSFKVYIEDNLAKADSKEQLLLNVTTTNITIETDFKTMNVPLSLGGMEGAGTSAADPYKVTTPAQLRGVDAEASVGGTSSSLDYNVAETEYYEQTTDLDLSVYADWKPVKSGKLYDGKGYKVNNLNSTRGGIFSRNGGTIQNVHLASGRINSTSGSIGGIVNECDVAGIGQKILNCSNAATITTKGWTGGIVGNASFAVIEYCKNTGNISSNNALGGIFGHIWGDTPSVKYCCNEGTIESVGENAENPVGGIGGQIYKSTPSIEFSYNIGVINGGTCVGSILGAKTTSGGGNYNYGFKFTSTDKIYGQGTSSITEVFFNSASNIWPTYSTEPTNNWGSAHWKSYNQGEYPKLLWEP